MAKHATKPPPELVRQQALPESRGDGVADNGSVTTRSFLGESLRYKTTPPRMSLVADGETAAPE